MIHHLRHAEIDHDAWDHALASCGDGLWYAQSWVLDLASPGWEALVDLDAGAIMPLTWRRKWGISYLHQPFGLQQLGVHARTPFPGMIDRFLDAVPVRFRYWDICIRGAAPSLALRGLQVERRTDQVLFLDRSIDLLRAEYAQGHRRNLRSTGDGAAFAELSADRFFALFRQTTGLRFGPSAVKGLVAFESVVKEGLRRRQCEVVALMREGEVLGAVLFATWQGRTILLKSANSTEGYEARAIFRIVDHWIERHAGSGLLLDFAGSMAPSVARFNAGFGAQPSIYLRLVRNLLPAPLRWLKR